MTAKQDTGQRGERLACSYLQERGYTIEATNWHCSRGEIDIVARIADTLVFVEVRTRRAASTTAALESIGRAKRGRIIAAAQLYVAAYQPDADWRVDVIAIALGPSRLPLIEHYEDALGW